MVVIGAGMSAGLVPLPSDLFKTWKERAENALDLEAVEVEADNPTDRLYEWAEKALEALNHRGVKLPKLRIAEALGLLTESEWGAKVGLPLRGTMPRHRVMARLAKEQKWASICSLNWDTHLENALECVGLRRNVPIDGQPWVTAYRTILLPDEDFDYLAKTDTYCCILKPHGCVDSLIRAKEEEKAGNIDSAMAISERFLITKKELTQKRENRDDRRFFLDFSSRLSTHPLISIGWSISEPYLQGVIRDTLSDIISKNTIGEFTIVDIEFNEIGHKETAEIYSLAPDSVFMKLGKEPGSFDSDDFFLWLQAIYAIENVKKHSIEGTRKSIASLINDINRPTTNHFLIEWADVFLPAWCRLCWRAELVRCEGFEPHKLRLELEDEHVPWDIHPLPRADLAAAAILLAEIVRVNKEWDFERFPGALFDPQENRLVVPIPAWGTMNDLAALKPMLNVVERDIAFVESVDILLVPERSGQVAPYSEIESDVKYLLSSHMRVNRFADVGQIGSATEFQFWQQG